MIPVKSVMYMFYLDVCPTIYTPADSAFGELFILSPSLSCLLL